MTKLYINKSLCVSLCKSMCVCWLSVCQRKTFSVAEFRNNYLFLLNIALRRPTLVVNLIEFGWAIGLMNGGG